MQLGDRGGRRASGVEVGIPMAPGSPSMRRKNSNDRTEPPHVLANSPKPFWNAVFGSSAKPQSPRLPQSRRPFYDPNASPRPGGGPPGPNAPSGMVALAVGVVLRPLYLLGRRGPLFPLLLVFGAAMFFITYSTRPAAQSVKLRVQGAVGPYIPQRAADAMKWSGQSGGQAILGAVAGARKAAMDRVAGKGKTALKPAHGAGAAKAGLKAGKGAKHALPAPRKDSRMVIEEGKPHPIPGLIARGKERWEALKARQSKTFDQAVKEYIRRNGRKPPKGFDQWYAFAKAHKVLMIDEFDLIDKDLLHFRAFRPSSFRARVQQIFDTMDVTWRIRIENGKVLREGDLKDHDRAKGVAALIERFVHHLPDMSIAYNGHDGARTAIAAEERQRLEALVKVGKYDDSPAPFHPELVGPPPGWGYQVFCPAGSAVREPGFDYGWAPIESTGHEMPPMPEGAIGTVLDDYREYMNVCESPQYRHFHATSSWVYQHHPTPVLPLFTPGVQDTLNDIHSIITEQLELEAAHNPTWDERPFTSLQWRGQTSGPLWEKNTPWRSTHRARLHLLSHTEEGSRKVVLTDKDDLAVSVELPNFRLNPLFLDVGMIGPAVQCVKEDGTCDEMLEVFEGYDKRVSFDRASLYKYVLDVDGNSWSGRFRRLMQSNAAVVKTTLFPEFWTDWAMPWVHFIPIQLDYSDMWDVLAFFRGGLDGEGAHDDLAREIATAGKEWVREYYRPADIEAYQYRLMLEYARLYNDGAEEGKNDFDGDTAVEPVWQGTVKL